MNLIWLLDVPFDRVPGCNIGRHLESRHEPGNAAIAWAPSRDLSQRSTRLFIEMDLDSVEIDMSSRPLGVGGNRRCGSSSAI